MTYRAVIFDLFGTLVDNFSAPQYRRILNDMCAILKTPRDDFRRLWAASFHDRCTGAHGDQRDSYRFICRELGIAVSDDQIEEAFQLRLAYTVKTLVPRPDTLATLQELRSRGYGTALLSDCSGETPFAWPQTAFAPLMDVTVYSCVTGVLKPDPRLYMEAAAGLWVKPEECVYVGDGNNNELTGACKLSMRAILIRDPDEPKDIPNANRQDDWDGERIAYLSELLDLLP